MFDDDTRAAWLVAYLESKGAAVPAGTGNRAMCCPFHDDRHASATIHTGKGLFSCQACGVAGDAISLSLSQDGLGFRDAVNQLQAISGTVGGVVETDTGNGRVFARTRNHTTGRGYVPPRLRHRYGTD